MEKLKGHALENMKKIKEIVNSGKTDGEIDSVLCTMYLDGKFKGGKDMLVKTFTEFHLQYPNLNFPEFELLLEIKNNNTDY